MPTLTLDGQVVVDVVVQTPPTVTINQTSANNIEVFVPGPQGPKGDKGDTGTAAVNVAQTWTKAHRWEPDADFTPVTIKGFTTQTSDLFNITNNAGASLMRVTGAGQLFEGVNRVYSAGNNNIATTVVGATTYGLAAALGTSVVYARADHHHGTPPAQTITAGAGITATISGVNYTIANSGVLSVAGRTGNVTLAAADVSGVYHSGNANLATAVVGETTYGLASAVGIGTLYARDNHTHGSPPAQVITGGAGITATASGVDYTIVNSGVTSIVAGTNVTISGATGAVTINSSGPTNMVTLDTAQNITGIKTFSASILADLGVQVRGNGATPPAGTDSYFAARAAGNIPILVQAFTGGGQTADLTRWINSAGTVVAAIGPLGQVVDNGNRVYSLGNPVPVAGLSATGTRDATTFLRGDNTWATLNISNMVTTDTVQTITAVKTFTAGPVISGASLSVVNGGITTAGGNVTLNHLATPSGVTVTPQGTAGTTTYGYRVAAVNNAGTTVASATVTTTTGNAILDAVNFNRVAWGAVTGATAYRVYGRTSGSELFIAEIAGTSYDDTGAVTPAGALPAAPAGTTLVIRGWEGQSQNLQQWRRFDDAIVSRIRNDGYFMGPGVLHGSDTGPYIHLNGGSVFVFNRSNAANVNFTVQGMASQTGDLQRWLNSSGAMVSAMTANGTMLSTYARVGQTFDISATMSVIANAATVVPVKVRGATSQSTDLQQWQDSAGNILARVANDGTIYKGEQAVGGNAADTEIMAIMGAF